ncbi:hypothetical protein KW794_02980 [Candidatus Saccharibacteria bacterium]|nr:hypothetical protein [Candidatus Saccharibacteria bacterium]
MAEDQKTAEQPTVPVPNTGFKKPKKNRPSLQSRIQGFKSWYGEHKKLAIPASVLLLLVLLALIPLTRYKIGGLFIKKDVTIYLVDDKSKGDIFNGYVRLDGKQATENRYVVPFTFHNVPIGSHKLEVTLKYYKDVTRNIKVDIGKAKQKNIQIRMTATGRLLNVRIKNSISGEYLSGIQLKTGNFTTKTDEQGMATLVVDPNLQSADIQILGEGYNELATKMEVTPGATNFKIVGITPAGKIYFLSKLSGKIDVVKTNLDGTRRQTVLAGTGREDDRGTVLLASRDWKYLALLSRRAGTSNSLYLINTADDSTTVMDEGSVDFSLAGWSGDNFIYTLTRNNVPLWQNGRQIVKSFNASTKKNQALDQTTGTGSSNYDYLTETIGSVYAYEEQVFYIKNWTGDSLDNKQATLNSIKPDGSSRRAIRSFGGAAGAYMVDLTVDVRIKSPNTIGLHFYDGDKDHFYSYANGQVKDDPSMSSDKFYGTGYPTYLLSPSGKNTFWSDPRDGKNTLFIGGEDGQDGKQIATLSEYNTYGWFTDDYLLVSKNSSELYIMGKDGKQTPLKISDYHKPALTYPGYGGGYGGL